MERFQVLGPDGGTDTPFLAELPPMAMDDVACGGCAAKVGPAALARMLGALGGAQVDPTDDVARIEVGGASLLWTVDAFPAFTGDSHEVGRVAAANAIGDVLVGGGVPRAALAVVTVPPGSEGERHLSLVMAGVRKALDAHGVSLVGGHTTVGAGVAVGLSVLGETRQVPWRRDGAQVGDVVVLLGALGTGVLYRADMAGLATGRWMQAAVAAMGQPRAAWLEALEACDAHAVTDVTGFGLAGHLAELMTAGGGSARVRAPSPRLLDGAATLFARGLRSTADPANRRRADVRVAAEVDEGAAAAWFDPQTASGWVAAVHAAEVDALRAMLGETVSVLGEVVAAGDVAVEILP